MTFLPIVERELRVAARRPGTYWTRWFAGVGMMAAWVLLGAGTGKASTAQVNKTLFLELGILALAFCLVAGIFLTADCLSEEKREGTLGLLFLTDLRGYDVVLGKLIATSVHSIYGLVATFPVLALPLLMGGVTVGEFLRVVLALAATLLLSLSLGMFVSAVVRESRQAMIGTLMGLLLVAGAPWAVWSLGEALFRTWKPGLLVWPSPVSAFIYALDSSYGVGNGPWKFWGSLQTVLGTGLGLFALAAYLLPRACQEKEAGRPAGRRAGNPQNTSPPNSVRHGPGLREFLETNPYLWLASRSRGSDVLTAILFGLLVLLWSCSLLVSVAGSRASSKEAFVICLFTAYALHQVGKYHVAVEASRQLSEDRQNGALELLLVTPLEENQILSGQMQALKRRSRGLEIVLLLVSFCMCLAVAGCPEQLHMGGRDQAIFLEIFLGGIVALVVDFRALHAVGTWMGLRARRHHWAVLGTLGRVMLVPWVGILMWVFVMISRTFSPSESELGVIFALWFAAGIINDLVFWGTARIGLGRGLRYWMSGARAAGSGAPFPTLVPFAAKALSA
jgi:ABC-type transport system involved in cytochrome c biogenesis permease component